MRESIRVGGKSAMNLLVLDEDAIHEGVPPNRFSKEDVNRPASKIGNRATLPYFKASIGSEIVLPAGKIGDEGWFAITSVRVGWKGAGPDTGDGLRNYLEAGPGLGRPDSKGRTESLLETVHGILPLRTMGLEKLKGKPVCAVVLAGDARMRYSPRVGNISGPTLGKVAFQVLDAEREPRHGPDDLPGVRVRILDADRVCHDSLVMFLDAPNFNSTCRQDRTETPICNGTMPLVSENWNAFDTTRWIGDGDQAILDGKFTARDGASSAAATWRIPAPITLSPGNPVRFKNQMLFTSLVENDFFESGALFLVNADTVDIFNNYTFLNVGYTSEPGKVFVEMFGASGGVEFDQIEETSVAYRGNLDFELELLIRPDAYQVAVNGEMVDTVTLPTPLSRISHFEVGVQRQLGGLRGFIDSTAIEQLCSPASPRPPRRHPSCKRKHWERCLKDKRSHTRDWCIRKAKSAIKSCRRPSLAMKLLAGLKTRTESESEDNGRGGDHRKGGHRKEEHHKHDDKRDGKSGHHGQESQEGHSKHRDGGGRR